MKIRSAIFFFLIFITTVLSAQKVAILKYDGGGDWYANPTAIPNLIDFCNENIKTKINMRLENVEASSIDIFNYPIIFMTGHGNVFFTNQAVENLKKYLNSGGFLHISDNYGLDTYIRREMKKVFQTLNFEKSQVTIQSIISLIPLTKEFLKYTSMTTNQHKDLEFLLKDDWFVFTITKLI